MINEYTIIKKITSALYTKYGIKSVSIDDVSALIYNLEYDFTEPLTGQALTCKN